MFQRDYLTAGGLRIHYRTAGSGLPVVMLHPSPLSSSAVLPVARALAGHFRVIALDTPGYGCSESLPVRPDSLVPYVEQLRHTVDALGLQRFALYGAATGSQIAVEFARSYPERLAVLVMDTAGHIPEEMCERIVTNYFPDVAPRRDGAHLATLWTMVRDLATFFPWSEATAATRIPRPLPPVAGLQSYLLDYLRAGERYDWAYRPAFHNERAERVQGVTVPTLLARWPSSIALPITDALIDAGLPACVQVVELGPTLDDRANGIASALHDRYRDALETRAAIAPARASRPQPQFCGSLHGYVAAAGGGPPLVALHAAGSSAAALLPRLAALAGKRPVIALDLPGHGESPGIDTPTVSALAAEVQAALDALALPGYDLHGEGLGACVCAALAAAAPMRAERLVLLDAPTVQAADRVARGRALAEAATTPRLDGAHLLAAWHLLRDRRLWRWPGEYTVETIIGGDPDLSGASLQQGLVDLQRCGPHFAAMLELELASDCVAPPAASTVHASRHGAAPWPGDQAAAGVALRSALLD